jgi:hypothetical protein
MANMISSGAKADKQFYIDAVRSGTSYTLETFFKAGRITKLLDANPDIKVLLDSGAYSLTNVHSSITCSMEEDKDGEKRVSLSTEDFGKLSNLEKVRVSARSTGGSIGHPLSKMGAIKTGILKKFIDFSYNDSPEVKKYLDSYIAFIHKYKEQCHAYVNLDVIYNPERTWENQKYMESNGLRPMPVFHFGEDHCWLRKYMDEYDYIGIGGLGQGATKESFITTSGDVTFRYILESKQSIKTHGFAVTSLDLLQRYPYYSADSTTWVKMAGYGKIFIPGFGRDNEPDYTKQPIVLYVSDMGLQKKVTVGDHYTVKYKGRELEAITKHLDFIGVDRKVLGSSLFERTKANIYYFSGLMNSGFTPTLYAQVTNRRTFF